MFYLDKYGSRQYVLNDKVSSFKSNSPIKDIIRNVTKMGQKWSILVIFLIMSLIAEFLYSWSCKSNISLQVPWRTGLPYRTSYIEIYLYKFSISRLIFLPEIHVTKHIISRHHHWSKNEVYLWYKHTPNKTRWFTIPLFERNFVCLYVCPPQTCLILCCHPYSISG